MKKPTRYLKPTVLAVAGALAIASAQPAPAKADAAGIATVIGGLALAGVLYHASQPVNVPRYGVNQYLLHPNQPAGPMYGYGMPQVPPPAMPVRYVATQPAQVYTASMPYPQTTMQYRTVGVPVMVSQGAPVGVLPMTVNMQNAQPAVAAPITAAPKPLSE
ncbi:hypothetical protein Mmc1_2349 [Magnetococcus marinus MC-1]|uniref:Transmembrane protein n=1 Tax=Magnetococcus marinus (strain ATCC BAA-1437 / JCM 17883 / MC-1) TaxID=156889 RepID=A0LA56_MAGMM|nr:hypothetical protein [Magnetococcus marinus]ABK44849.1 hypothetical protein Mmc1_2349 [Magnetococcus marinus MC-1]